MSSMQGRHGSLPRSKKVQGRGGEGGGGQEAQKTARENLQVKPFKWSFVANYLSVSSVSVHM